MVSKGVFRYNEIPIEDQWYYRNVVRSTRIIFDALRNKSVRKYQQVHGWAPAPRHRGEDYAKLIMFDKKLNLNHDNWIFGSIPGVQVGDCFSFRTELAVVGLHRNTRCPINFIPESDISNREPLATSIVVSEGINDSVDGTFVYTIHGGPEVDPKPRVSQMLTGGKALESCKQHGVEIRVVRQFRCLGNVSGMIFVYDGLYKVCDYWFEMGNSGFGVCKYKLSRVEGQPVKGSAKLAGSLKANTSITRTRGYRSPDISRGLKIKRVMFFNDIDDNRSPLSYNYVREIVFGPHFNKPIGSGCGCRLGCMNGCLCSTKNGQEFAYDIHGLLLRGKPVVYECGPSCKCPDTCPNRVTQSGLKRRLEIFRSRETSWGVRTLDFIKAGAFICEYAGVARTREEVEVLKLNPDHTLIYPNRFSPKWNEWGDLSDICDDYVPPSHPALPPLNFALDVSESRNVACYISQSSTPNVVVQFVLHDHGNVRFPHVMFFALLDIPPMEQLNLDYGVVH